MRAQPKSATGRFTTTRAAGGAVSPTVPLSLQRILVPVDFSACSERALQYAAAFARRFKVRLVLLHVIELYPIDYVLGLTKDADENHRLMTRARQELARLSRQYSAGGRGRLETAVRLGKPYQEIVKAAREHRVQLVIMGTHGYTGFLHFQLGSTAERVVRYAPCPVLVVREPELFEPGSEVTKPASEAERR